MDFDTKLGQVWTPQDVAEKMIVELFQTGKSIRKILDPACGPGTFSKAIHQVGIRDVELVCLDVDQKMVNLTRKINKGLDIKAEAITGDYLAKHNLSQQYDAVIMNPPYIRHELIDLAQKDKYYNYLQYHFTERIDRRSNLFVLFLFKAILDLKSGGVLCAIVYDAISESRYGKKALKIMSRHAELIKKIHIKTPFNKTLIDAQILIYRKLKNPTSETSGDTDYKHIPEGCARLGDIMNVRRGVGLVSRKVFIAKETDPFYNSSIPFLMKQRNPECLVAAPDSRAYFIESFDNVRLLKWLKSRVDDEGEQFVKLSHKKVIGPIIFNYYIRNNPRHLWNINMEVVSDNFYVGSAKYEFPNSVAWLLLNSDLFLESILLSGRNQGSGLKKLQLYEYKDAFVPDWRKFAKKDVNELEVIAERLIKQNANAKLVRSVINAKLRMISNVKKIVSSYTETH